MNLRLSPKPFLSSFLLVFALMALQFCFFRPYFFANDDSLALMISKGVGLVLKPDEHLFFQNVLLGLFLQKLYTLFPGGRWYPGFEALALFLADWAFLSAVFLKSPGPFKAALFTLYFLFVGLFFGTQMDYTMIAFLLFQGGAFLGLALFGGNPGPPWKKAAALACTCLFLSALFRIDAFFFSAILTLPLAAWVAWKGKIHRPAAAALGVTALLIFAAVLFDHSYYQRDPAWRAYMPFHPAMVRPLNYQHWTYDAASKPVFDAAGWTPTDFQLFSRWYFLDPDTYSVEHLQRISSSFGTVKAPSLEGFATFFSTEASQPLYTLQNIALCFAAFLLFCPPPGLRFTLENLGWVVLWMGLMACFSKFPEKLYLPAFSYMVWLALDQSLPPAPGAVLGPKRSLREKAGIAFLGLLLALTLPNLARFLAADSYYQLCEKYFNRDLEKLDPKDDQLYVVWNSRFPYEGLGAFSSFEVFRNFHILSLASLERTPLSQAMLGHFGVKNVLRDMVDNPNILMFCSPEEGDLSVQYLREKFGLKTRLETVFTDPFFTVDRIRSILRQKGGGK